MTEQPHARAKVVALLNEIYQTASVPYKATEKMAYITDMAGQALAELGERDLRWPDGDDPADYPPVPS